MTIKENLIQLVVLGGVFGGIGFIILNKIEQNNPGKVKKVMEWFKSKKEDLPTPPQPQQMIGSFEERRNFM